MKRLLLIVGLVVTFVVTSSMPTEAGLLKRQRRGLFQRRCCAATPGESENEQDYDEELKGDIEKIKNEKPVITDEDLSEFEKILKEAEGK